MSQYSRVALLVVMLVGALSMPFVSIFGLQFAASFQAAAGLAIPAVCALMSGGCQWTAAVASGLFAHVFILSNAVVRMGARRARERTCGHASTHSH
eukprot:s927_g11.t3